MKKLIEKKLKFSPLFSFRHLIIKSILRYKILFISAQTGSGKTTIIPQLLLNYGLFDKIIVSQTKRIAAVSSAKYVSAYFGLELGKKVGYSVRFDEIGDKKTSIKFVTDGILFKEISKNFFFAQGECLIIDEFHERTIFTDLLLSFLKKILSSNKINKLIIMSATGNSGNVAKFFGKDVGKIILPGKLFDVRIFYSRFSHKNFIFSVIVTILKIHFSEISVGNILVFLPGLDEIEKIFKRLIFLLKKNKNFELCKLYASVPIIQQRLHIETQNKGLRKIILSTNIAESSLTIPGIAYVIDCGLSKQKIINRKNGIELFKIFPISRSEIHQRSGRAGRTVNGKCFRLFTFCNFKKLHRFPRPELERVDLSETLLSLCSLSDKNIFDLDLISLPPKWGIIRSLEILFILGAIDKKLFVTFTGKCMSFLPTDTKLSRSIIESLKCNEEKLSSWVISASACFSTNSIFYFKNISRSIQKNLKNVGDFFFFAKFLLNYECYINKSLEIQKKIKNLANQNFFKIASNIKSQLMILCCQLKTYFQKNKFSYVSALPFSVLFKVCFVSGFFINSAIIISKRKKFQIIISGVVCLVHPQSFCKNYFPKTIIFREIFVTTAPFVKGILPVRLIWLLFFGGKIFK